MSRRYFEIYEEIRNGIMEGKYKPGDKLPSENDYCQLYNTSRGTVRRALDLLAEEGLVNSLHGKGVYVLDHQMIDFSFGGLVSFKEASESSNQSFTTEVPRFEEMTVDDALHRKTNLPVGKEIYSLERVRRLDGEEVILDLNCFAKDIVAGLTREVAEQSIYQFIEETLQLKIGFAKRMILVEQATTKDKKYLDLKAYPLVVVVKNFVYLNDGTQFEYTESRHRPDRFVFTDFVRRR